MRIKLLVVALVAGGLMAAATPVGAKGAVAADPPFTIAVSRPAVTVAPGLHFVETVAVTPAAGFAGLVSFSIVGWSVAGSPAPLPAGIWLWWQDPAASTVEVAVDPTVAPADYAIAVVGTDYFTGATQYAPVAVHVVAEAPFSVSESPDEVTVAPGDEFQVVVTVTPWPNYQGSIGFYWDGDPPVSVPAGIHPTSIWPGVEIGPDSGSTTLGIKVDANVAAGDYRAYFGGSEMGRMPISWSPPLLIHVVSLDTTPPVIEPRGPVVATTGDYHGALVTYTPPTATDDRDGPVPVSCAPASGSVFALGTTAVECSASDAAGNRAESTFDVTVTLDVRDALTALTADVAASSVGNGVRHDLETKLDEAARRYADSPPDVRQACFKQVQFAQKVAERANQGLVTSQQATIWLAWSNAVTAAMGCS